MYDLGVREEQQRRTSGLSPHDVDNYMNANYQRRGSESGDDDYVPPKSKSAYDDDDEKTPILEIDGDLYNQKLNVDKSMFVARLAETGGMLEDMGELLFDFIRAKDVQQVRYDKR